METSATARPGASSEGNIRRHERLEALYHMAVELSALRSLDSVLNTALQHCLDLTDSQFGFMGLTTDDRQAMDVVAIQGFHPAQTTTDQKSLTVPRFVDNIAGR